MNFYCSRGVKVRGLFIDYGQLSAKRELKAARQICTHYGIQITEVACSGCSDKTEGIVQGRNAFLLFAALMEFGRPSGIIALGIHACTPYIDCSSEFIKAIQSTFDDYTDGRVRLSAPFVEWKKQDIWLYCQEKQVPVKLTYSCEKGCKPPCGRCLSCLDRKALYALPKHDD